MSRGVALALVDALLVLAAVVAGVIVASTSNVSAPTAWTLVAVLAAAYIVASGAARGDWLWILRGARHADAAGAEAEPGDGGGAGQLAGGAASGVPGFAPAAAGFAPGVGPAAEVLLREEQVHVERRERPRERIRLRKHVVVEYIQVSVPVRREEVRLERVPLDAPPDPTAEADVLLMEDDPVLERHVVTSEATTTPTPEEMRR
jgi:hypothetical protein